MFDPNQVFVSSTDEKWTRAEVAVAINEVLQQWKQWPGVVPFEPDDVRLTDDLVEAFVEARPEDAGWADGNFYAWQEVAGMMNEF